MERHIGRTFIIPVIIFIYGLWQYSRVSSLAKLAFYFQDNTVIFRYGMTCLGIVFAVLAAVTIGYAMALCHFSARASRKSQDILIAKFTRCRRLLPFLMVGEMVFCGLAIVCIALSEIAWFTDNFRLNGGGIKIVLIALFTLLSILWMLFKGILSIKKCFAIFQQDDSHIYGVNVLRDDAPALWSWVETLAQRAALIVPDNIVIGYFDCFYVTANAIQLEQGARLTGNTLYLPLGYAALMDKEEIAAVIGHELGHFTGNDTQYSLRFAPLYAGMITSLHEIANGAQVGSWVDKVVLIPSLDMGAWFLDRFHETVSHWSRIREYAADEAGARAASAPALSSALLRITALSEYVDKNADAAANGDVSLVGWVENLIAEQQNGKPLKVEAGLETALEHPMDSHPATRARIENLGVALHPTLFERAARPVTQDGWLMFSAVFNDITELCLPLAQKVEAEIHQQKAAYREALESHVQQSQTTLDFWGNKAGAWFSLVLGGLFGLGGLTMLFLSLSHSEPFFPLLGCILLLPGLLLILAGYKQIKQAAHPLFSLNEESITSCFIAKPLPLHNIDSLLVRQSSETVTVELYLRDGYEPDITTKRFMRAIRFDPGKRAVTILLAGKLIQSDENGKQKLDGAEVAERIAQYLYAVHARDELKQLQADNESLAG